MNDIILYTTEDGRSQIQLRADQNTVWLTQLGMAELLDASKQSISLQLKNILEDGELEPSATVKESLTTESDDKTLYCPFRAIGLSSMTRGVAPGNIDCAPLGRKP